MSLNLGLGIGLPLGGGGFDPAALFTVSGSRGFLYDFSDYSTQFTDTAGTTVVTGTGAAVARVNDKSGLGNNATQTTAGNRPVTTEISGYRGIAFDGATSNRWLQTAAVDFSNSDKVTVVAGVRKLSDAAVGAIVELGPATFSTDGSFVVVAANGGANYGFITRGTVAAIGQSPGTFTAPISNVVSVRYDNSGSGTGATAQNRPRVNGVDLPAVSGTTAGNYRNDIVYIGRRAGSSLPFNGVITFLFAINRLLTASELAAVEQFANSRTGAF